MFQFIHDETYGPEAFADGLGVVGIFLRLGGVLLESNDSLPIELAISRFGGLSHLSHDFRYARGERFPRRTVAGRVRPLTQRSAGEAG